MRVCTHMHKCMYINIHEDIGAYSCFYVNARICTWIDGVSVCLVCVFSGMPNCASIFTPGLLSHVHHNRAMSMLSLFPLHR